VESEVKGAMAGHDITELMRLDGSVVTDGGELGSMAMDFYRDLYTSEGVQGMAEGLDVVPRKVTTKMNAMLYAPLDAQEVKHALF
jgi:hypothetical protein